MAEVVIYGTPTCPDGLGARRWLSARGLPFTFHDVTQDPEARDAWERLYRGGNPTILIDGRMVMNGGVFTDDILARWLDPQAPRG